jgi:transposase
MEAIVERCCGLDVHQANVVACLMTGRADEKPRREIRSFSTTTAGLEELAAWLRSAGCSRVAMESTGVYWVPVHAILEKHFEVVVGNAHHLRNVPGRKTDALDSEWLAELLRHGLIRPSFIPPPAIRELRDLTRYRRKLVDSRSAERNRLQKLLESANIKLSSVMSNVFGVSGMAMLKAMVEGGRSPKEIAALAQGSLRRKRPALVQALDGRLAEHHRYLLQAQMTRLEQMDAQIDAQDGRIGEKLEPYREQHTRLMQIPGVDRVVAATIIAELGVDMSIFDTAEACAAWVGVCPGNNESAGKRKSGKSRQGNSWLTSMLVEAAHSAVHKKGSYFREKFYRLRARRGYKRAVFAIAHKILIAVYHMLKTGQDYRDLGQVYLDRLHHRRHTQRLVRRLELLGYHVKLEPLNANATSDAPVGPEADPSDFRPVDPPNTPNTRAPAMVNRPRGAPQEALGASTANATHMPRPAITTPQSHRVAEPTTTPQAIHSFAEAARPAAFNLGDPRIPPVGHSLVRIYKDVEHRVLITPDGFEYQGTLHFSLSGIAQLITGTTWNGFRFFRLDGSTKPKRRSQSDRGPNREL